MARRGPFLPRDIAEAAIDDTTPAPVAMPRAFEVDAVDQEASGFGRGPVMDDRDPYGIRAPYQGPPEGYYGASSSPGETLRNVGGVFNPFSENSVFGSMYGGDNPVLQELARPSNYVGAGAGVRGLARGALSGIGGRFLGEAAMEALPEDANPLLKGAVGLGAGLVGGGIGYRAVDDVPRLIGAADRFANPAVFPQEASQIGRVPGTDSLLTAGPNGEVVGPTGNVGEMLLGREPGVGENVNARRYFTNFGRAQQAALAVDEQAAFRAASERAIAGAVPDAGVPALGGGADLTPDEVGTPDVLYHHTSPANRASIEKLGLLGKFDQTVEDPSISGGTYLTDSPLPTGPDDDVWAVATRGLKVEPDWTAAGATSDAGEKWSVVYGDIPPTRLSRVDALRPGGGADLTPDEFARLTAKKAAGEALTPDEQDSVLAALGKAIGASTADEQAIAREALYNGPVPTDMREVDTGLIEGVRGRLGAPTGRTVEDALKEARAGENPDVQAAIQKFGLTNNVEDAGFVLPDGRMLDFKHGSSTADGLLEHESVAEAWWNRARDGRLSAEQAQNEMLGFMEDSGALRIGYGKRIAQFGTDAVTPEQRRVLGKMVSEITENGRNPYASVSVEFPDGTYGNVHNASELGALLDPRMKQPSALDALSRARQVGGGSAEVADAPLTPAATQNVTPQTYTAPPTLRRLFGARDIVPGETRGALERVAEEGRFRADDPIVTPALRVRDEARRAVTNQATRVTAQARTLINRAGFEFDEAGRIKALAGIDPEVPGAPTLRDVAARLPRYADALTPPQRQALEQIRELVAPYRQALDEVAQAESALTGKPSSIKIGSRADVLDGGFYIPRGNAETEALAEIAAKRVGRSGGRVGGRQGFERSAQFASEAEGIAAGYRYTPIDEALASYVRGAGNRALDRHTANYFLSRVDESGKRIAQSRADRIDPELRGAVESVRSRIASRLQTLRNQTVRGRAQGQAAAGTAREAQRLDRLALSAETRAVLKKAKIEEFDVSTPDAILESFPDMDTLRAQADATRARLALKGGERGLAQRLGEQEALKSLRSAAEQSGGDLDRMLNIINEYGEESARYAEYSAPRGRMRGATAPAFGTPERVQWELDRKASGIHKQRGGMRGGGVDAPFVGPDASYRVYDDILAHALDNSAIWASRTPGTQASIRAADRELKVLLREARRAERTAQTVGNRAGRTDAARQGTLAEIDALRTELDALTPRWQRAQEIAAQTPRDKATIPLAGLDAYAFPYEMADEAARVLQRETRDPASVDAALRAVNSLFRGIQATGEMSYLGIQNLMGTVADPVAGYRAAKASTQAWLNAGDEVLGDFIARFDAKAVDKGLPNSERWAASGLRLGAAGTEFRVGGRKVPERIANVVDSRPVQLATAPVRSLVKRADRGFGVAGDTMRLELADTLAEEAKLAGRTLDDKALRSIAETANRVTGWTPQRAFGDWGELVNFAPRYLAARARALGQLASTDPYKRDLARRIVGRYLMIATTMTIAANYLNGEETDYHPFSGKNGPTYDPREAEYKNPNFMRVMDVAGRDWSLLGPMDALLGTVVGAGSLLTNPTGSPKEALERLRSIFTSPAASAGLDWVVFGENFEGDKLTLDSEAGLRDLMGRVLPFAAGDLGSSAVETARLAQDGRGVDAGVEAVAGIGQGFLGGRGSRETAREGVERGRFAEMTPDQQFKAIPAQAWMVTVKQAPEQYKAVSQYATAGAFYQALVDEYTKGWIERGASPLDAEAKARASAARHPVYKAYNNARNYYENWWTEQNPEQRQADAEAQMNLPPSERRNMPRQQERRIIQEATR